MKKIYETPKVNVVPIDGEKLCSDSGGVNVYLGTEIDEDKTEGIYGSDYDHDAW